MDVTVTEHCNVSVKFLVLFWIIFVIYIVNRTWAVLRNGSYFLTLKLCLLKFCGTFCVNSMAIFDFIVQVVICPCLRRLTTLFFALGLYLLKSKFRIEDKL